MVFINPVSFILELDIFKYLIVCFGLYCIFLLIKKVFFG